jgi:YqaJ-like viral recombinase domain
MGKIIHAEQGTPEWFASRLGCATASRFSDVCAEIKSGEAAGRRNYRGELVTERIMKCRAGGFEGNKHTRRGNAKEPYARTAYALRGDLLLTQVGFMLHDDLPWCGASLDSFVDDEGHIEIKCPTAGNHFDTLLNGMPSKHRPQIQGQLWVRGPQAKWCDFISFCDEAEVVDESTGESSFIPVPQHLQLYIERVERDDVYIAKLAEKVKTFLGEVEATIEVLNKKYEQFREAA